MRIGSLALMLACAWLSLCACGGALPPRVEAAQATEIKPSHSPFADKKDFEPEAFHVSVVGSGRPIIFIPGLGSPGEVWDETVEHLGDDYECHVLTLAGFAGQPPIEEPLSAAVRRDLTRYIRSRGLRRPIIVGHSMGGFIALWIAASYHENIGPVIVVDAGPALSGDMEEARQLRDRWAKASDEEFALQAKYMYAGMATDPKRLETISTLAAKSDRRTIGEAIFEMMSTDLSDLLEDIRAPVLFVLADGPFQTRIRKQAEPIREKEFVLIPRARHFVMIDDPKRFFAAIDDFLEEHPGKE